MKKSIYLIALLLFATTIVYGQNTVHVTNANDTGIGSLRYAIITTAIDGDSIVIDPSVTEIVLASAIYITTSPYKSLAIEGNGCVVKVTSPGVSTYRCLTFSYSSMKNISLHNMTLKGGNISGGASADNYSGGAIFVKRVNLKMYNCTITDGFGKKGGAISDASTAGQNGSMLLVNCTFSNNKATDTGAVIQVTGNVTDTQDSYRFIGCTFSGNQTTGSGSTAVYLSRPATITNCIFSNNISNKVDPSATDVRNTALSVEHTTGTTTVENCLFDGNYSTASSASANIGGTALVHYNRGNFANTGYLIIKNTTFTNNKGGKAAVYLRDGNTTIVNCTFAGNKSGDPAYAGALCVKDSVTNNNVTLVNNIFAYNYDQANNTEDVYVASASITHVSGSNNLIAVTTSNLSALANPVAFAYAGGNNDSPLFASYTTNTDGKKVPVKEVATGTVPLMAETSIAIGAGTISYGSVIIPTTDQRGKTRATTPCIGAYEFIPTPTFSGTGSWSNASNWNVIPTSTDKVIIGGDVTITENLEIAGITINSDKSVTLNAGKQLTVTDSLAINGTLNLLSDATGPASLLTSKIGGNGTAKIQQFLTGSTGSGRGWWYISSPVTGATSSIFDPVAGINKIGYYNESNTPTPDYTQIGDNTTTFERGKGYVVYLAGADATYTFSGTLDNGNITLNPTRTGTTEGKRGFNLVGNPYPSYLNWTAATKNNVRNTIWYRTYNGTEMIFDTFDGTTGTGNGVNGTVNQYIPPMQAFWIRVDTDGSNGSLNFDNTMCSHQTGNLLKVRHADKRKVLRLKVSNGTNSDEALLVNDENASDGFDQYDAQKMSNKKEVIPEIYTLAGNEELVINHQLNFEEGKEIALGFRTGRSNIFSIQASEISGFESLPITLIDKVENKQFDMTTGAAYEFTSNITDNADRFAIAFRAPESPSALQNAETRKVLVYANDERQITVILSHSFGTVGKASVFNIAGQKLAEQTLNDETTVIDHAFEAGVYLIKIENETKKVIVK